MVLAVVMLLDAVLSFVETCVESNVRPGVS